jgi:OOP family OmpA-OmpF porin
MTARCDADVLTAMVDGKNAVSEAGGTAGDGTGAGIGDGKLKELPSLHAAPNTRNIMAITPLHTILIDPQCHLHYSALHVPLDDNERQEKSMQCRTILMTALTSVCLLCSTNAFASTNRFSLLYTRPVPDGGAFFTVFDTHTLQRTQLNLGAAVDYAYRPLLGTSGGTALDITRYYVAGHLFSAFGATDWLTLYADMPIAAVSRFVNPDAAPFPAPSTQTKIGDLELGMKFRLLDEDHHLMGIAVIPMMTVPTGNQMTFMGNDGVTGGGQVAFSGKPVSTFQWGLNIGALARKHVLGFGLDFGSQFLVSAALRFNVVSWAAAIVEVSNRTPFGSFYSSKTTSPTDFLAGVQWRVWNERPLIINTSAGYATPYGSGSPQFRALASVSYAFAPFASKAKPLPTAETPAPAWTPVFFNFGSARITPDAASTLQRIASDLQKSPRAITITGHADNQGKPSVNQRLSVQRAQVVKNYLRTQKIPAPTMTATGQGERTPATSNRTAAGRAQNRRVEIH